MQKSAAITTIIVALTCTNTAKAADYTKNTTKNSGPVFKKAGPMMLPLPVIHPAGTNWSGLYFGVNWGVAKGLSDWKKPISAAAANVATNGADYSRSGTELGMFGGVTQGYNYQLGSWVIGAEADLAFANINSNTKCSTADTTLNWRCSQKADVIGSLSQRIGYAFGNSLVFAKAGLAYAHGESMVSFPYPSGNKPQSSVQEKMNRVGFALGLGYEYNLGGNWSSKAEYTYYAFSPQTFNGVSSENYYYEASSSLRLNVVKFGLNYRFGVDNAVISDPAPRIADDFSGEFGARLGWSGGEFKKNLWDPVNSQQLNSRLTWYDQNGGAVETFARLDHSSGVFMKGFIGGVDLLKSKMTDEDFPPEFSSYSNTRDITKDGRVAYATFDLGYDIVRSAKGKVGAFLGYNRYEQSLRAYGCHQIATHASCLDAPVPNDTMTLGENERWNSVRLGLGGEYVIMDRLKISGDFAWLPLSHMTAYDNHWLRANINPLKQKGKSSKGYQLEAIATYSATKKISFGIGARYWKFDASGYATSFNAPMKFNSDRTTVFTQVSYAFGG